MDQHYTSYSSAPQMALDVSMGFEIIRTFPHSESKEFIIIISTSTTTTTITSQVIVINDIGIIVIII